MNKLYYGDNLDVMRKFIRDETVDLCYIDPPFNSKRNYNQIYNNIGTEDRAQAQAFMDTWTWDDHAIQCYDDILTNKNGVQTQQSIALISGLEKVLGKGSLFAYLVSMTVRVAEIHRILKPTGSFYLHCDPTASHYLKIVVDAVFAAGEFRSEVIWQKIRSSKGQTEGFGSVHDTIFLYTKTDKAVFNHLYTPLSEERIKTHYGQVELDTKRRFGLYDFTQSGQGEPRTFGDRIIAPPAGKHWIWGQDRVDAAMKEGRLVQTGENMFRVKRYLDESRGNPLEDIWIDIPPINAVSQERLGYPTQKPEALLQRIIEASSNEGDIVLDAFCGCGTTIAVADRLKRQWIGMDITYQSVSLILKRLKDHGGQEAIDNVELHGVPKDMESVDALIHKKDDRVRKEFEKWAVLTYSDNRAVINEKKGADKGIDGIAYTRKSKEEVLPVIISVKSGNIGRKEVAQLHGDAEREGAACAILITRNEPTKPMIQEAKEAGKFQPDMFQPFDRLQIVTVQEILDGARMNLPLVEEVTKKAQKAKKDDQPTLLSE